MKQRRKKTSSMILSRICLCTLIIAFVSSCVNVDFTDERLINNHLPYQVQVKWDTDSMPYITSVVMKRIVNNWNYVHTATVNENGKYDSNVYSFDITEGTYRIYAYAYNPESVFPVVSSIENMSAEDIIGNANNINIKYHSFDRIQYGLSAGLHDWVDYNNYTDYVRTWKELIMVDSTDYMEISTPSSKPYVINPKPVTQKIKFRFTIEKDVATTPFVVDSVLCEISGIPTGMNLGTKNLDISRTHKTTFYGYPCNSSSMRIEDQPTSTKLNIEGSVRVLGLVSSNSNKVNNGPGILQLVIFTHSDNGESEKHNYVQAIMNMRDVIYKNKLTYTDEKGQLKQNPGNYTLTIDNPLFIDGDIILTNSKVEGNGEQWISGPDTDIDI